MIDLYPEVPDSCFIAEDSTIVGNVFLGEGVSVWHHATIRGDQNKIEIEHGSNIQDSATVHVDEEHNTHICEDVTVGHGAVVHGCYIGKETIIGMNATVLSGAKVGKGCIIGANALVPSDKEIPDYSIAVGVPVDIIKKGDESLAESTRKNAEHYHDLRDEHNAGKFGHY